MLSHFVYLAYCFVCFDCLCACVGCKRKGPENICTRANHDYVVYHNYAELVSCGLREAMNYLEN